MIQKVLKVGSSAAVTIPKKVLREMNVAIGDQIAVTYDKSQKKLVIEPSLKIDKELVSWTRGFIEKYRPALEALAKK